MKPEKLTGHAAMFGANAMWGIMSPVAKMVMAAGVVSPIVMTDFRILGAAILFWIASFFTKREPVSWKDLGLFFLASQIAIVFNQGSFIFGVSMTSPIDASIITTSLPILTLIIAAFYLKEPVTGKKITGIVFGATGAILLVMSGQQLANGNASNIRGDLLCLTAQLCFSIYLVFFRGLINRYSPITIMKWMFTGYLYTQMTGYIPYIVSDSCYVKMLIMGIFSYLVVCLIQIIKIQKIPKSDALKNLE